MTATYLTNARRRGQLQAHIVCGRACYSTAELYRFITSRPTSTRRGPSPTERKNHVPNVDQSLTAIRASEAVAESFDRYLDAANVNRLFDPDTNPQGFERIADVVRRARFSDDTASEAVPQLVFMGEPEKVHVLRDLREIRDDWRWLWGVRWTTGRCDIGDAPDCLNTSGYEPPMRNEVGPTAYVTVSSHPPVTVAVEICGRCLAWLREVSEGGEILTEIPASARADAAGEKFVVRVRAIRAAQAGDDQ
ncbi:hypothetical protein ASE48_22525 [Mycobacterium sp. Root265]|uniref:hypothetical protein n=1 Tax=Mycobacterium sp. Root265 TaxID=1736504 RepID=UPI00071056A9|nr:hypothetical protein [Mycobacterium sp. Root265]KRD19802.1 hypothetical protein ASE48_22525 [Mycobacterium sp. Root265]